MVLNFAHRGSVTEAPENTVAAVQKALAHGVRGIEIDVQLTKDNRLIVIHDHHLKRFNKKAKRMVSEYTLAEIKQIDTGTYFSREFANERLATLEEVLDVIPREVLVNIEIKNKPIMYERIEEILLTCLREYKRTENVMISSFDHVILQYFQGEEPDLLLGLLFEHRLINPWEYARNSGLDVHAIHPSKLHVDPAFIACCHDAGYKVYPYTVNDIATYDQFVEWGIDGVFSNHPAIFSDK